MTARPELDLTMPTRDDEEIWITTAAFTSMGVAEVVVGRKHPDSPPDFLDVAEHTVITAKQARQLADAFDKLATFWGE
jgi:hypothetical protein